MINSNKTPKILVIGDLIVDNYLWGSCDRISPEAPVQIVNVSKESTLLGGAGNVINNLNSLGAQVDIISIIGQCEASQKIKNLLSKINISTQFLFLQKDRVTSEKSRVIASHQQVVRYDIESNEDINKASAHSIIEAYKSIIEDYDIILLSDYGKGVLTYDLTQSVINIAHVHHKKVLVDPKGMDYSKYKGAYLLTPNKKEASEASQININSKKSLLQAIKKIKKQFNLSISIITLSEQGVAIFDDEFRIHPTSAREVYDVTGAGDTILASLGYAISCDVAIDEAIKFANLASGIVVGKIGSATATINEIIQYESSLNKPKSAEYIKSFDEIVTITSELKNNNKKIIFTNGCFDIIHLGHIKYLEKAKSFGDILIVGLNSDKSVKENKGSNRPINLEDDRAYILASLEIIDYVVIFDKKTPIDLIKLIQPDILVKGGDYKGKTVVGQDIVKDLRFVDFIDGKSTSKTIESIKNI
jgi:D-beta-D-heptose 7-phosphate kinase / D-beta-D-heptose 1-phosphate adenosyltransferase